MRRRNLIVIAFALLAGVVPLLAIPVTGRVVAKGRVAGKPLPTFVYAESLDGGARSQPARATLKQHKKTFLPRVVAIPTGSTVVFPNDDEVFHNVFSLNQPEPFDLGLYRSGASKSMTFKEPGVYRVFCNIHPQMAAVILVVPTPQQYIADVDPNGSYRLDLPAGRYRITAWSERAEPVKVEVTVSATAATLPDLTLDESKAVVAPHTDKFGKEYPKSAYDGKK
jgi:plastocyanin